MSKNTYYHIFPSFVSGRSESVKVEHTQLNAKLIISEVAQGYVLCPILFLRNINENTAKQISLIKSSK